MTSDNVVYDFSIIIPTYNRPEQLAQCLASLTRLDYPRDRFEVIVVDDGGVKSIDEAAAPYRSQLNLTTLRQTNAGPGRARNTGADIARGEYLAFTDDDCWPEPDWLTCFKRRLDEHPDRIVGGKTVNRLKDNACSTTSQVIVDLVYMFYNSDPDDARFFASNNLVVPASMYHTVGGFNRQFFRHASEDRELCDRWRHRGYRMTYAAEAVVLHAHPLSCKSFCKQHFMYGRGAARYHEMRKQRGSGKMRQDMGFHAQLPQLVRRRLEAFSPRRAAQVLLLLGMWQLINVVGYFYEKYVPAQPDSPPQPDTEMA